MYAKKTVVTFYGKKPIFTTKNLSLCRLPRKIPGMEL
jgi:hypothetical protein